MKMRKYEEIETIEKLKFVIKENEIVDLIKNS